MTPDLFWIPGPWRGRLAIAARPRGGDWLQDEVSGWRQAGIDIVVSLLEGDEAEQLELGDEGKAVSTDGLIFISFPIPDRGVPSSTPAAGALMARIAESLEDGKTIAVHCRQGIGRSGLIAIGVLMVSGLSSQQAIQRVSSARGMEIPETSEQLSWAQQLPAGPTVVKR